MTLNSPHTLIICVTLHVAKIKGFAAALYYVQHSRLSFGITFVALYVCCAFAKKVVEICIMTSFAIEHCYSVAPLQT